MLTPTHLITAQTAYLGVCIAASQRIRLKLLKIGARVKISVRRVWLSLSESYPYAALFAQVHANLRGVALYGASPLTLLQAVQAAPGDIRCLLMIAHNPEIGALARALAGPASDLVELEAMRRGFAPGDLALLAYGATVVARGAGGERTIPIDDFFTDLFENALEPGEILTEIRIPSPGPNAGPSTSRAAGICPTTS